MHVVVCTDSHGVGGAEISLANLVATVDTSIRVDVLGVAETVVARVAAVRGPWSRRSGGTQAMLAELPVVATRVGSVAELVADGHTGLLLDRDDVDGLVAALQDLRDDGALRARLGTAGRKRVGGVHSGAHGGRLPAAVGRGGDGAAHTAVAAAPAAPLNPHPPHQTQ